MVTRWVLLCCSLLLGACGSPEQDAIRFALASAPANLDPRFATDASSERINRLLYARLVDFDERARPVASLATWERLTPRHYRFRLRDAGRAFHNGEHLTAADVAATYRSVLAPESGSPHRGALSMIERIEIVDEDTLDFFLERADVLFPGYLSLGILPASGIAGHRPFHRRPLGSGPFRFAAWSGSGALQLMRREDGQRLVFEEVQDPTMRVLKLLRGEVDLLQNDLPPELLGYLEARDDIRVGRAKGGNFAYLGFNLTDPAAGRWEVRRAVALAIDRAALIEHLFRGAARPASALLPPEHWAGAAGLPVIGRDLEAARALLRDAGFSAERPLRLSYKTSSDPFRLRIATVLQQQLAEAGIEVDIRSYDWGTFYGDIKAGRFQMYSLAWVGVKSPDIFRYAFHSASLPPAGANRGRLSDARVDALIGRALGASRTEAQAALLRKLQALLLERLPYVPLWFEDQFFAARTDIQGYRLDAHGDYDALRDTVRQPLAGAVRVVRH
ncbi:MAG: ABC transporter substrate-binding protein [Gammaproteobacteria bacterium]|jgi:peptide/nickel transport system substrate-binding protein